MTVEPDRDESSRLSRAETTMPDNVVRARLRAPTATSQSARSSQSAQNPTNSHALWRDLPFQTVGHTAAITGRSPAHVYSLLKVGDLQAVKLGGKTLIPTQSILAYLARAKPWRADARRVAAANEQRIKVGEK